VTPTERIGFYLFVATVAAVFVSAAGTLVRITGERIRRRPPPSRFSRWYRGTALTLGAVGILCVAYGRFVEPYWPEVAHVRLESAKLPVGSRSIRVVQLSDLHCDPTVRLEERLPEIVAAERPDAIVFTGDAINSPAALDVFRRCASRLAAIAPTYAVLGNWDVWFWSGIDLYAGTGVHELDGTGAALDVGAARLWIAGVAVEHEALTQRALEAASPGAFTVFLEHYPDDIEPVARTGRVDLYCAGHTHGGQVALPGYGAILTLSRFGKRYESGLYRVGETRLYVNRGIGMEGGSAPRVRFWARPEVTVFEIAPAQPTSSVKT
jgi:predicted MPP superfamily phosphohydrolase